MGSKEPRWQPRISRCTRQELRQHLHYLPARRPRQRRQCPEPVDARQPAADPDGEGGADQTLFSSPAGAAKLYQPGTRPAANRYRRRTAGQCGLPAQQRALDRAHHDLPVEQGGLVS